MLQVKSFKFSEDTEINALLSEYRLAPGASVFVSNNELIVPYDDGEPANNAQRAIDVKMQKNELLSQIETHEHSIKVVEFMDKKLDERLATAEADLAEVTVRFKKTPNDKKVEHEKLAVEGHVAQIREQQRENEKAIRSNKYEIERLEMNVQLFDDVLASLSI